MKAEKVIKDLVDLREAAAQAVKDGSCRIRLASGESLVLYPDQGQPAELPIYDVTDPAEREVVLSCLEPGGKVYSSSEAREELKRRLAARGINHADDKA